eukprot:Ihof_evm10s129 gene=Ihof_evmTU10s129
MYPAICVFLSTIRFVFIDINIEVMDQGNNIGGVLNDTLLLVNDTIAQLNDTLSSQELRAAELSRLEDEWRKEHSGHEVMHQEMVFIIIAISIIAQMGLVYWKKTHITSYKRWTLAAMWIMPLLYCIYQHYIQFLCVWSIFSMITGWITYIATRRPVDRKTPRLVYRYLMLMFKLCYFIGLLGYLALFSFFVGFVRVFVESEATRKTMVETSLSMLMYGLYFGCVLRDFAEISAESMASTIGFYSQGGMPKRALDSVTCAVCAEDLFEGPIKDKEISMPCLHRAHEHCLQGWYIVGKKDICPYCKEKVDFSKLPRS